MLFLEIINIFPAFHFSAKSDVSRVGISPYKIKKQSYIRCCQSYKWIRVVKCHGSKHEMYIIWETFDHTYEEESSLKSVGRQEKYTSFKKQIYWLLIIIEWICSTSLATPHTAPGISFLFYLKRI